MERNSSDESRIESTISTVEHAVADLAQLMDAVRPGERREASRILQALDVLIGDAREFLATRGELTDEEYIRCLEKWVYGGFVAPERFCP
jgi:uncharacterized protein YutE (UPF0331/DUF86 family)